MDGAKRKRIRRAICLNCQHNRRAGSADVYVRIFVFVARLHVKG